MTQLAITMMRLDQHDDPFDPHRSRNAKVLANPIIAARRNRYQSSSNG